MLRSLTLLLAVGCAAPTGTTELVLDSSDGLNRPQDLEFNPDVPGELWVVNRKDDSMTIVDNAPDASRTSETIIDPAANHFMERVSSIAFGKRNHFATCQDSRNTYDGQAPGNDFMGPALWSSDRTTFGESNPEAVAFLTELFGGPADLGSHLDMLHQSPLCMGIAWETDNVYWVFDGDDGAIVRYDFVDDHDYGYDDHSDGIIHRYASGQVKRVAGTVSHMEVDHASGMIYISDSGNGRIARLDMASGNLGDDLFSFEPGVEHKEVNRADLSTFVEDLGRPAGLALVEDHVVITDALTSLIHVFDMDGVEVDLIETEIAPGGLAGIEAVSLDEMWYVDADGDAVYRWTR